MDMVKFQSRNDWLIMINIIKAAEVISEQKGMVLVFSVL